MIDHHKFYMEMAIELAKMGGRFVSPNPQVGCILVKDGRIIAEGYHEQFGGPHAEIMALHNAHENPEGSTAYITLEPCSIHGKTPPCTRALIDAGVRRVFVGIKDPNPAVNGNGIDQLEERGIEVYCGISECEIQHMNRDFIKWVTTGKPWVIAKVAQSVDGCMGKDSNSRIRITGDESMLAVHQLRSEVDAILIGRQTALVDNPKLTVRKADGRNPVRVIIDGQCTLPLDLDIFRDKQAETIILCSPEVYPSMTKTTYCTYLPVRMEGSLLDPDSILEVIGDQGFSKLLIEGGANLLECFQEADLIDEIHQFTAPVVFGTNQLMNPLRLDSHWNTIEKKNFGADECIIAVRRKEECLQV